MADLLNTINDNTSAKEGEKSSTSNLQGGEALIEQKAGVESFTSGQNLLGDQDLATPVKKVDSEGTNGSQDAAGKKEAANSDRSQDSLYDEIRELRAENKARRIQVQEEKSKIDERVQEKLAQYEEKLNSALSAKDELEALKAKEADKKRSVEEKLAHREAVLAQAEADKTLIQERMQEQLEAKESELVELRTAQEAQKQVYEERIKEEMDKIPETRRKFAEMMIRGHNDPREAWAALSEAKQDGLFEDKVTVVSHATPGANASRMTQDRLEANQNTERSAMSPQQKIAEGLKQASRQGKLL